MVTQKEYCVVQLTKETRARLKRIGRMDETMNDLIVRLLEFYENDKND